MFAAQTLYEIEYVETPTGLPCKLDHAGVTYNGMINVAQNLEPCLTWRSVSNFTSLLEAANYSASDINDVSIML